MQSKTITLALLTTLATFLPALTAALPHHQENTARDLLDLSTTLVQRADIPICCTAALNAQSANGPNAAVEIKNAIEACRRAGCTSGSSSGSTGTGSTYTGSSSSSSGSTNDTTTTTTGTGTGTGTNWQTAYEPTLWHEGCQSCPGNYGPKGCMCEDCGYMTCKAAPGS